MLDWTKLMPAVVLYVHMYAGATHPADVSDLVGVVERHGGKLDTIGHPTTTLEDYFLHIVEQSKAHPGRRYLPGKN